MYAREHSVYVDIVYQPSTLNNFMLNIKTIFIIQSNDNKCRKKCDMLFFNKQLVINL